MLEPRVQVSVLMSVYAREKPEYLDRSLSSVESQTLKPVEIVLVENGPLGGALDDVVANHVRPHPELYQVIKLPENVGLGGALSVGLGRCSQNIVARMDSDDICAPCRFETEAAYLSSHPEITVVGSWIAEFETDPHTPVAFREPPCDPDELRRYAKFRNPLNHMTVMMRRDAVVSVGGYSTERMNLEDYLLWIQLLSVDFRLANIPEHLVYARAGYGMYGRRGGWRWAVSTIHFLNRARNTGFLSASDVCISTVVRTLGSLLSPGLRRFVYLHGLRRVSKDKTSGGENGGQLPSDTSSETKTSLDSDRREEQKCIL
ncbi:MAG: glycosyltransferase [Candidatus Cryosericum sp.]